MPPIDPPDTLPLSPGEVQALMLEGRQLAERSEHQLFPDPPAPPAGYDLGQLTWLQRVERIGRPDFRGE